MNLPWTLPCPSSYIASRVAAGGVAFLAFEQGGFVGVGGVGAGDLEDVPAEVLEGFGVVLGGEVEQVAFGLLRPCGVEVVG